MPRILCVLVVMSMLLACNETEIKEPDAKLRSRNDYIKPIRGKSDAIPVGERNRGEVLIAYSDCSTCHKVDERFKGPAFKDIAARYPVNDGYIETLALRIIVGGSGAWGYSVMSPHPNLTPADARTMVKYILSLKE